MIIHPVLGKEVAILSNIQSAEYNIAKIISSELRTHVHLVPCIINICNDSLE